MPCSQGTVSNIGRQWLRDRSIEPRHAGGRRRKTTREQDERIIEAGIFYKFETIEEVMNKIREELNLQINVSVSTINRRLLGNSGISRVRINIGNSENSSTIIDNSREIFLFWVNFGTLKIMQNFLENGLRSRRSIVLPKTQRREESRSQKTMLRDNLGENYFFG